MEEIQVTIPKGTIINLNGFRAELAEDTLVISSAIKEYGLDKVLSFISSSPSSIVNKSKAATKNSMNSQIHQD